MGIFAQVAFVSGACWLLYRVAVTWRDQAPVRTVLYVAGAWGLLLIPIFALTGSENLLLLMMCVLLIGFPTIAGILEFKSSRERSHARANAAAAGMDHEHARRAYRRQPRHPVVVGLIYCWVAMVFVALSVAVVLSFGLDPKEPSLHLAGGEQPPYDMPWWIGVMGVITFCGLLHAMVNFVRRT